MGKNKIKQLIHNGIDTVKNYGSLSDPLYKSSTLIFKDYKEYLLAKKISFLNLIMEGWVLIIQNV